MGLANVYFIWVTLHRVKVQSCKLWTTHTQHDGAGLLTIIADPDPVILVYQEPDPESGSLVHKKTL